MRRSNLIPASLAALALALAGCLAGPEDRSSGVDDFPNSIYARVDGFLDEGKKAEGLAVTADTDHLLIRQTFSGPAIRKRAAGAYGAADPSVARAALPRLGALAAPASADTCPVPFVVSERKLPVGSRVTIDTLVFCMDAEFLDSIKGNEHVIRYKSETRDTVSGRVERGEFRDADGDGFLNPLPGGASKAEVEFTVLDKGIIERTWLVVGDGPDDDIKTEKDNLVYEMSWSRTQGADTLAYAVYADADSDGVALDNGKPSLVDVTWFAVGPTEDDPGALWSRLEMRTVAVYGKAGGDPRRFSIESENKAGRHNSAVILGPGGGEDFDPRDTVEARFRVVGTAPADSVDTLETRIRLTVGDFDDKQDDTTYAIHCRVKKKLGEEALAVFSFVSAKPIPKGKEPAAGDLYMRIDYRDGTFLDVDGKLTEATVDVTAAMRDGKRLHAVWDRSGKGISLERLD